MNYIALDLEWNQSFNRKYTVREPVNLYGEIVQIGAVKVDEDYHMLKTFKILVTPQYYHRMHRKVSRLTGITNEDLKYGFPFPVALKHFQRWCGEDFAFLTWGSCDVKILQENMALHKLDASWLPKAYDVQMIFDHQITQEHRQVSLTQAMETLKVEAWTTHDALNDARNTVCICQHLDMEKGLSEYAALQKSYSSHHEVKKSDFSKTYEAKEVALVDPELIRFRCPLCGKDVVCKDIVMQNSDKSIGIGLCDDGDELLVRFRFRKGTDGRLHVSRIVHEMNEGYRQYYTKKKQRTEAVLDTSLQHTADTI